jgi:sec-independent protein translocase protein TatA
MGMGGISVSSLLIILVIVLVLFGGKRIRSLGDDLGGAIKGFRHAVKEGDKNDGEVEAGEDSPPPSIAADDPKKD